MTDAECIELMRNIYLGEPITIKGDKALTRLGISMTEREFFDKVFVEPFTLFQTVEPTQGNSIIEQEEIDTNAETDLPTLLDYAQEVDLNTLKNVKGTFEERIKNLSDALFVIKGGAGTGKTTYAHYLKKEYSDLINFTFFDFEKASQSIFILTESYDFKEKYYSNVWKFVSILTSQISFVLERKPKQSLNEHKSFINQIVEHYHNRFETHNENNIIDTDNIRDFFKLLRKYRSVIYNYSSLANQIRDFFSVKFDYFESLKDKKLVVEYVTSILIRLYYCVFKINQTKSLCVIDNIERFVKFDEEHPIEVCEVQTILNGIMDAICNMKVYDLVNNETAHSEKAFYGFMLVTRDTSISLAEYHHYDDYNMDSEIDITNWFCADHIFTSKDKEFGQRFPDLKIQPKYIAYHHIMNDLSPYNWGMHDVISKIYNGNNRRIARNVIGALAAVPVEVIKFFNAQWEQATSNSQVAYLKHLCRKFIFRILLDRAQTKKYFDKLLVEVRPVISPNTTRESPENSSYARKIANILYREAFENNGYCTFPQIIEAILRRPYGGNYITPSQIDDLATILYLMNETRNEQTNWAPLIMIKFDSEQTYNKNALSAKLLEQWTFHNNQRATHLSDFEKYGIKITMSGSFFAKICADFEYFACRYAKTYPALFVTQNLRKKIKDDKPSYDCLDLMNIVKYNAFACIDEIIKKDTEFFSSMDGFSSKGKFCTLYSKTSKYKWLYTNSRISQRIIAHPIRIINNHMGYISHYKEFVKNVSIIDGFNEIDRNNIILGIDATLKAYEDKKHDIIANNQEYFAQEN